MSEEFVLGDYVSEGTVGGVAHCQVALSGGDHDGEILGAVECDTDGEPLSYAIDHDGARYEWPGEAGKRDEGNRRIYRHVR